MEIKIKPIKPRLRKLRKPKFGLTYCCFCEERAWIIKFGESAEDAYNNWKRRFDEIERSKNANQQI